MSASLTSLRQTALQYSISCAPIFSGLPEEDLGRMATYCQITAVARGNYLFRQGDPVVGFYLLRTGMITVHRTSADGSEQIIHQLRPGQSFAERAISTPGGYPASARAVEDSEVILIPTEEFMRHQKERPDLAWRIISSMSHHLRTLVTTIEGLRLKDVEARLIHWLLQRCPDPHATEPVEIQLQIPQGELARELAATRETVSRSLRKLRQMKLIQPQANSISILDPSALYARLVASSQK